MAILLEANIKATQDQIKGLLTKAQALRAPFDGKMADMPATATEEYEGLLAQCDKLGDAVTGMQKELKIQSWGTASNNPLGAGGKDDLLSGGSGNEAEDILRRSGRKAFAKFITGGSMKLTQDELKAIGSITSTKAYQADDPAGGGFLISPQQFVEEVLTLMKDEVFARKYARVIPVNRAESLGVPALDTDPSDADWTTELAVGGTEATMAFGKRELRPHPVAKLVLLSNKLIRNAAMDPEGLLKDRLAYKFGVTQEKGFLTGDGNDKPLGVFTASSLGISTGRDTPAASSTVLAGDDFIKTLYSLKAQYRKDARWIINRAVLSAVRRLKDQNNNYIWAMGLGPGGGFQGTPEMILGLPYDESEYAPSTLTSGLYAAAICNWKYYWIADALDFQLQVLDQIYATTNQMAYIGRMESDGMPVLEEAFARLKMA